MHLQRKSSDVTHIPLFVVLLIIHGCMATFEFNRPTVLSKYKWTYNNNERERVEYGST
jgi:hypothetical protein